MVKFDITKVKYVKADSLEELEYKVNEIMNEISSDREYWSLVGAPVMLEGWIVQTLCYTRVADTLYEHSA